MARGEIGCICTPAEGKRPPAGARWCADNGCFGKGYPGDIEFLAWLARLPFAENCAFAVAPDVVGDADATLARSGPFLPVIRAMGFPVALAAQNGLTPETAPWDDFDVLFLGGSPECVPCGYVRPATEDERKRKRCPLCGRLLKEWKLGEAALALANEAHRKGRAVHMGRVNSGRRMRIADAMGCESVDGTYVPRPESTCRSAGRLRPTRCPTAQVA